MTETKITLDRSIMNHDISTGWRLEQDWFYIELVSDDNVYLIKEIARLLDVDLSEVNYA